MQILCDFKIQRDHLILARRSNLMIINRKKKKKEKKTEFAESGTLLSRLTKESDRICITTLIGN